MKLQQRLLCVISAICLLGTLPAHSVPAYPKDVFYTQPDGKVVKYRVRGDENIHWMESSGGYLLKKAETGYLMYAEGGADALKASSVVYTGDDSAVAGIHRLIKSNRMKSSVPMRIKTLQSDGTFPLEGKRKLLMLLVNFADTKTVIEADRYSDMMNEENYNGTGSFRDFYLENSYGKLDVETTVMGWITLPKDKSMYSTEDMTSLITDALTLVDDEVDLRDYDNDGDGVLDGLSIIHQGQGAEVTGMPSDIWSHSAELLNVEFDGVRVRKYTIQPELLLPGQMATVGVFCHEFGHNLGAPDFYDVDYETGGYYRGTGVWDCMAEGIWNEYKESGDSPSHINMWQKMQFGWVVPEILTESCTVEDVPVASDEPAGYIMNTTDESDYFVLENRYPKKFDRMLPGNGLIIYHVDEDRISGTIDMNEVNATSKQGIYTVCASADGEPASTPASFGDINSAGAPFPGTSGKTEFSDATLPSSHSNDGKFAYCKLTDIESNGEFVSFNYVKEEAPAAVRDFSVSAKRGVVALSWVAPGEPGVELYRIFRDGEFLTSTQELAYIDRSLTKEVATYQVDVLYENGLYSPFASATVRVPVNRIESLSAVSEGMEVTLSWDMEMRLTRCTDMTLDNVVYEYVDCTELDYAQRFDAADLKAYIGYNISRISFFPFTSQRTTTYKIRVWRMPEGSDAAEVVSERTVSEYASGQWCERLLLDPVAIEAGYDYLIGVNLVTTDGTIRLICESENTNPGLGNLTMVDGIWSDDLLSLNPLLRADLEKGEEPVFVPGEQPEFSGDYDPATDVAAYPLGFNVYRDDELIGFTSSRTFIDCSASQGSHKYGVVCLYEGDNESAVIEKTVYHYAGVEDAAAEGIAVRASGNSIFVETDRQADVHVYNVSGQLVAERTSVAGTTEITLGEPGVYVVKVNGENVSVIEKLILY